jgi:hypothetical protein
MRTLILLLTMLLATAALAAPRFDEPQELMEYAYRPYLTGDFPEDPFELWSPALLELFADMVVRMPEDEVGAMDFDSMINAQDHDLREISIGTPERTGEGAVVTVTFENLGRSEEIRFTLVENDDAGWKIADIESLSPNFEWRLSEILAGASAE